MMFNGCFLLCEKCNKETIYIKKSENKCTFCNKEIILEEGIEALVIFLNNEGLVTISSCEGHNNGFDQEKRSFPNITFLNTAENYKRAESIIKEYNRFLKEEEWMIRRERTTRGIEAFIIPVKYWEGIKILQKKALNFAKCF